jgi:hypothetical protein
MVRKVIVRRITISTAILTLIFLQAPAWAASPGVFVTSDCTTIGSPVAGSSWCYNTTTDQLEYYSGTAWVVYGGAGGIANSGVGGSVSNGVGTDGIANVRNFGAKGDGKILYAGAMDNNATTTLTDTTNSPFAAGDVGKLICVDGAGASGVDACGTISSFTDNSHVVLSFNNTSGAAISGKEYRYASDDTTAIDNAIAALPKGGTVFFPSGLYGVNGSLTTLPANVPFEIVGSGSGATNTENSFINGNTPPNASNGTALLFLTKALAGAAIKVSGSIGITSSTAFDRIAHIALLAGAGRHFDGGGSDAIDILNWQGAELEDVLVFNFAGNGVYLDGLAASSYKDYLESIKLYRVFAEWNGGAGVKVGSTLAVNDIETINIDSSILENNSGPGVLVAGANVQGFSLTNNTIQWNNVGAANPEVDISGMSGMAGGCSISGNYIEADTTAGSQSNAAIGGASLKSQCQVTGNYYLVPSGSYTSGGTCTQLMMSPEFDAINDCNGDNPQIASYWGIKVYGNNGIGSNFPSQTTGSPTDPAMSVIGTRTAAPVFAANGPSGLTSDIADFQVNGTTVAKVDASGNVSGNSHVTAKLASAPFSAIGAGNCEIFAVAGTNAGTCKLEAICGTSTTPVAIIDNVGGGC